MSISYTRSHETDSYEVLTSYSSTPAQQEVDIVSSLVKGRSDTSGKNTSTPVAGDAAWDYRKLEDQYVDTSALYNTPAGSVTQNSAISLEHVEPSPTQKYSVSLNVDNERDATDFEMLGTTTSLYDSNLVFTHTYSPHYFSHDETVKATFDHTNENHPVHHSVNSPWNSKVGPFANLADVGIEPLGVQPDTGFNDEKALGMAGSSGALNGVGYVSKYAVSAGDAGVGFITIDDDFQPEVNNLEVVDRVGETSYTAAHDSGIFKLVQNMDNTVTVGISAGGTAVPAATEIQDIPLMDANGATVSADTLKSSLLLPAALNTTQFNSLFNEAVLNTVTDDYEFAVNVASNANSGYHLPTQHPLVSDLDNSNILDNPFYMLNNVHEAHSLDFSSTVLSIVPVNTYAPGGAGGNGSAAQGNVDLISINLDDGETLSSATAGEDGVIYIQTNTETTRTAGAAFSGMDTSSSTDISVMYTGDNPISDPMKLNPYVHADFQKVALRSSAEQTVNPDNVFLDSNGAFLTMYTTEVVNDEVEKTNTTFNFTPAAVNASDSVNIWKVDSTAILVSEPESLYANQVEPANLVSKIKVSSVLKNLVNDLTTYDEYRNVLTAKTLVDISLKAAVAGKNWSIGFTVGDFLRTSSVMAFNNVNSLPNYNSDIIEDINGGQPLYYKYEYKTGTSSTTYGGIVDYVEVTYSKSQNLTVEPTIFKIPQTDITRAYDASKATREYDEVPETDYSFSGTIYTKEQFELVFVTKTSVFNVSFLPQYGPYTNIRLHISGIRQTDTYYAIRNKTTGTFAPHSALKHVSSTVILPLTLKTISETIAPPTGGSFTINGTLTAADLKGFKAIIQGRKKSDDLWYPISDTIDFDTYYGLNNIQTLSISTTNGTDPDVTTTAEYDPFEGAQEDVTLIAPTYMIPLVYDVNDINYRVSSFTSTADGLKTLTSLPALTSLPESVGHFSLTNEYACINSWSSDAYSVSVSSLANVTTFSVTNKTTGSVVFTITKPANLIFLGTQIVTYIPKDVWVSKMQLGASSESLVNETLEFYQTDYINDSITFSNVPGIKVAIHSTIYPAGCGVDFRVIGDLATVYEVDKKPDIPWDHPTLQNELGLADYNSGSLIFQYEDGDNYSAIFTLAKYRGLVEPVVAGQVQEYVISRPQIAATFRVGTSLSQVLTYNMYYDQVLTVNNLQNSAAVSCANLNISCSAKYSLPPTGYTLLYGVSLVTDTVTTTITNTNYVGDEKNIQVPTGCTPVDNPTSYDEDSNLLNTVIPRIYTFSGASRLSIAPSRIRMNNAAFPYNSLTYSIKLDVPDLIVYRAIAPSGTVDYLGNPAAIGSNDPSVANEDAKWQFVTGLSSAANKRTGVAIGRKVIRQNAEKHSKHAVTYYVSALPQFVYTAVIATNDLPPTYDYASLPAANIKTVKLGYDGIHTSFNPFAATRTIKDINAGDFSYTNDPVMLNDITIQHLSPPTLYDLIHTASDARVGVVVNGVNLNVMLYSGLNSVLNSGSNDSIHLPHTIYGGPITDLRSTFNVLDGTQYNHMVFKGRDADGSIRFSIAQFASDIGYADTQSGYQQLYKTTDHEKYYNLDFKLGHAAWLDKNNVTRMFNAAADGIRPTLYTVIDVNDNATRVNSRRVYRYISTSTYKIDDSLNSIPASNFSFTQGRSYYDILVDTPTPPFNTSTNNSTYIWNYSTLLANTNVGTGLINWIQDTDFNVTDTVVSIGWVYANSTTAGKMPIELFYLDNNATKWFYMTLLPYQNYKNQYGLTNAQIAWDGSLYSPLLSTKTVSFQTQPSVENITTTYQVEQYSITSNPIEAVEPL